MKLLFATAFLALLVHQSRATETKLRLLFSIDQGFGNGIVANGDVEALHQMVSALEPLRAKYEVSVLLNPMIKDKARLKVMLDTLVTQKMPFVFDVYSSDSFTLGANGPANAPFDSSHGQSISVEQLVAFKESYGASLAGLRFMEIFGQDYGIRAMKTTNPELKRPGDKLPADAFFRPDLAEGFIRFAKEHAMFVQWADFGWMPFSPWDKEMPRYTEQVKALLRKHPGVVTVTYNNNEPNEAAIPRLSTWRTAVEPFPKDGAAGYGLSNQSWLHNITYMDTKPEEIIAWTQSALDKNCRLIQFEPAWYFFNLPAGTFELGDSKNVPAGTQPGEAREPLKRLIGFLSKTTPPRESEAIFKQPAISDIKAATACVIGEVHPDSEKFYVRIGNYGKTTPIVPQAWDTGAFTGLKVPAGFQFGPMAAENSAAVQVHGREIGIWIDSDHPRPSLGSLLPITPAYWWWDFAKAPMPFAKEGAELRMSFEMKVPTASREGAAQSYITVNFLFLDTRSQKQFWLAANLFDLRPESQFPDTVHFDGWEGGTQIPILYSALNHKSQWLHPGKDSALFTTQPFSEYRRYDIRVIAAELKTAIIAMQKRFPQTAAVSDNIADLRLIHFNLNPEVFAPKGSRGRIGLALRDVRVDILSP
ncbi:MAG: hypothetical protein NTX35_15235 [Verrucomicrobia bacterium]|nr:hypothetical protein [Verrucomicrobiota bacterium]